MFDMDCQTSSDRLVLHICPPLIDSNCLSLLLAVSIYSTATAQDDVPRRIILQIIRHGGHPTRSIPDLPDESQPRKRTDWCQIPEETPSGAFDGRIHHTLVLGRKGKGSIRCCGRRRAHDETQTRKGRSTPAKGRCHYLARGWNRQQYHNASCCIRSQSR